MRKPKVPDSTVKQLGVVAGERAKQDAEWGMQDHALDRWSTILAKQHGAMAQAIIAGDAGRVYAKAKQVAAVAVAVMEMVEAFQPSSKGTETVLTMISTSISTMT